MYAAGLLHQADVCDLHIPLDSLAHIVDGQGSGGYSCEGLHFNTCLSFTGDAGPDFNGMVLLVQVQVQPDAAQKEGMAHGDQVRCPLGAHDAGNLGCRQHIAFFHPAAFDQFKCMGIEQHTTFCHGSSFCNLLVAHIDHPGPAALVKMGEILFCHFLFVSCAFFITVFITVYNCFYKRSRE